MAQLFSRNANTIARLSLLAIVCGVTGLACYGYWIAESPYETRRGVPREQPVPFSHEHHVLAGGVIWFLILITLTATNYIVRNWLQ